MRQKDPPTHKRRSGPVEPREEILSFQAKYWGERGTLLVVSSILGLGKGLWVCSPQRTMTQS